MDANFDGLSSLSTLALSNNNIKSITSAAFHYLETLENLFLDRNSLRELAPRIFYKLDLLKRLDLSHNNIISLEEVAVLEPAIAVLRVHDNPWSCDCSILWIRHNAIVRDYNPADRMT